MSDPQIPHLNLISHNLQNIYAYWHDQNSKIELVPALFGHKIYCSTVGWKGRFLRVIYICIAFLFGDTLLNQKLKRAILQTQKCYTEADKFRQVFIDKVYQDYLKKRFKNLKITASHRAIHHARKQLTLFNQATGPLTKLIHKKKENKILNVLLNQKMTLFLHKYFKGMIQNQTFPFYHETTYHKVKDQMHILALEGMVSRELPLNIFKKTREDERQVNHELDGKALRSFIKHILQAKQRGTFHVEIFKKAIKSITCHLERLKEESYDLKILMQNLIKEGCIVLEEFDPTHLEWREQLTKGSRFISPGEAFYFLDEDSDIHHFELGETIPGDCQINKNEDHYKVFEIHDPTDSEKYQDHLLMIGPNKICMEYNEILRREENFWGLAIPKLLYIHPKGKYAVVQKLQHSLNTIIWQSKNAGTFDKADEKYANPLLTLIEFFIEEKNTPKKFHWSYLKFDNDGRLMSTKECIPSGSVDVIALEKMIYKLSQKKLPIYQYLIQPLLKSNQFKKIRNYFKTVIKNAFENHPIEIRGLSKKMRIDNTRLIKRAMKLDQFINQSLRPYGVGKNQDYIKHLKTHTITFYEKTQGLGRFWQMQNLIKFIGSEIK